VRQRDSLVRFLEIEDDSISQPTGDINLKQPVELELSTDRMVFNTPDSQNEAQSEKECSY